MLIRTMKPEDLPDVIRLWNECVEAGDVLYAPMTEDAFRRKFTKTPGCEPERLLVAEAEGRAIGFLHGVAPETFPGARPGCAFLTVLLVSAEYRKRGIGRALLNDFLDRMASRGAHTLHISGQNPVSLDWCVPGTPGHDHNNMPGADTSCAGYSFLEHCGFTVTCREIAMYGTLSGWKPAPEVTAIRQRLQAEGIETGPYDPALDCDYDQLCSSVRSDYWHDVLQTEIAAWKSGTPNADPRMWADGLPPKGPRTLITAVHGNRMVGFTGPVDLQKSGRGWFTGICTDAGYERRGIATVLFNLLLEAFVAEGAVFTTLFTGLESHARKIYERAGLRPVRQFNIMALPVSGKDKLPPTRQQ